MPRFKLDWSRELPRPIRTPKLMLHTLDDVRRFLARQPPIADARWSATAGAVIAAAKGRGEITAVRHEMKRALAVSKRR